ncbi:hypothetical protein CPB84DRAFT_1777006 [Gymnopilus junonius]|uniref:Bromo domain-containing protein n=1 Tax=Gymnopilus junonius TaxID=109634 RepID=A0A9P5NPG0_GYMJU|nr:hypothetical protein CPB84DRAFT_1777006 [Gymnopilus junonius]
MNNLLRTLTESKVTPTADLKLLLTSVKEGRKSQDSKLTDPFYDSLEGLLNDLKTITIDNHDAEAFLRPVSKTEVPDYLDVIQHPMDFQTMLRKVKSKQYKSKREFKDDLDLIWSNCLTYNATENHPLRPCVHRLKAKAEKLLKHITDRKERADPPIPSDLPSPIGGVARPRTHMNGNSSSTNGYLNGRSSHTRSPSLSKNGTPKSGSSLTIPPRARKDVPFAESLAIVRTPEGMGIFREWDMEVDTDQPGEGLVNSLRELAPIVEFECEEEETVVQKEDSMMVDGAVAAAGDKRRLNGNAADHRPRKKARFSTQYPTPLADEKDDATQLWWVAVQSDALLGSGLPGIPFGPSSSKPIKVKEKSKSKQKKPVDPTKRTIKGISSFKSSLKSTLNLLTMMNTNIKTMRRLRHTHSKFAALNDASAPPPEEEEEGGMFPSATAAAGGSNVNASVGPGPSSTNAGGRFGVTFGDMDGVDEDVNDKIDESPWTAGGRDAGIGTGNGKGKGKTKSPSGIELGAENASDCLRWTNNKVLEHVGFQGTSTVALDVLADVTAEYLQNVGRTIKFLSDKFGRTMTPEEIILHTLFESGSSKVQDLERYISDDIERYGLRLGELEKKLGAAYRESTAGEVLEDEGLFEEDSEEPGILAMGDFADLLGEDYLGFRELGIAEELGLSNLSIPKKLLRGKKVANRPTAAKPTEPPPPYPPPPPFVPLTAEKVDDQIGLLKGYYQGRFGQLAASTAPPPPPAAGAGAGVQVPAGPAGLVGPGMPPPPAPAPAPVLPPNTLPSMPFNPSGNALQQGQAPQAPGAPAPGSAAPVPAPVIPLDLALPDELPDSTHMKVGPIGQILLNKAGASSGAGKKKGGGGAAAKGGAEGTGSSGAGGGSATNGSTGGRGGGGGGGNGLPPGVVLANAASPTTSRKNSKKGGNASVTGGGGTGAANGGRKKKDGSGMGPPPGPGLTGPGGSGSSAASMYPAVVFASA